MDNPHPGAIAAAVEAIRSARIGQLTSSTWLEHELLPQLGLSAVDTAHLPAALRPWCGRGLCSFQQPNQFSRYLCHLSRQKITSYLEIGVWQGGTFVITVEYLSRFNDLRRALAVDIRMQEQMRQYAAMNDRVEVYESDSKTGELKVFLQQDWWDLAFIDGDHTEEGCFSDYQLVRDISGMVALHDIESDICAPVGAVWRRLSAVYPRQSVWEFCEQYVEVLRATEQRAMGIGLIETGLHH